MAEALRIISFNNMPGPFDLVCRWVEQSGHTLVMVVTTPGPPARRSDGYKQIIATAGAKNVEVLCTTRMKSVATPVLRALKPDLIVSATFPWLLPPELLQTARIGAVNLHPALLPAYRGPNVARQIFDGGPWIGSTLHWTAGEFDTGNILSQQPRELPQPCTPEAIAATWFPTLGQTLFEGAARAIAGDPGTPQPEVGVSYAAPFTEAERWLDFHEPRGTLMCKCVGLNLLGEPQARAKFGDDVWRVERIDAVDQGDASATPGTILDITPDGLIVQTGDGLVQLRANRQG